VANYNIDIGVKVQSQQLDQLNKKLKSTETLINNANKSIKNYQKGNLELVKSINGVNTVLNQASKNFREVAVGTPQATRAAKEFVKAEQLVNKTLAEQEKLLENTRRKQQGKEFTMGLRSKGFKKNQIKQSDGSFINQRRAELQIINRAATLEDRINQTLAKRGKILSANGKQIINNNKARNAGVKRGNAGNLASSAIIGGAFPLLFGQSGTAAVGGAVGGAAGGLIGGQFGFALSILGTAIGQFIDEQDKLDRSLSKISRSFINAGNSAGFTRESFNNLRKTTKMTKDEVLGIASAFARFGEAGEAAAFIFGDNPQTFKNLAAMNNTKTLMTAILDEQNGLNIEQQIQLLQEAKITSFKDMQLKVNRLILEENYKRELAEARQISNQDKILDFMKQYYKLLILTTGFQPGAVFDKIFKGIFQKDKLEEELQAVEDMVEKVFPDIFNTSAENAEIAAAEITKYYEKLFDALPELQDLISDLNLQVEGMSYSIPSAIDSVSAELRKLMSVGYMVTTTADTIGSAFGESFKGIVKGSMTAQDALRNLFQRTADAFLDMAAQMIAKQIQMQILGIGLKFFGGASGNTDHFSSLNLTAAEPGEVTYKNFEKFANGGRPPIGRPSIVGERGAELFVPDRAGTIIPNHQLGGSTNIVVNVDASGSSVEGDEEQGRELGRMISVAIQSELIKQKRPGGMLA
jgi:hypothetical protein